MGFTIEQIDAESHHLKTVRALWRKSARTLGHFPEGAFHEYALRRHILVAMDEEQNCIGYLLYRISRGCVTIVHLCVDESRRGRGVARALFDHLRDSTKRFSGIGLRCRRDFPANAIWPRLNFVALSDQPGKGRERKPLTHWWFDHGHATLFTAARKRRFEDRLCIIIDTSVFLDLMDDGNEVDEASRALLADWVADEVDICVTDEILNEINRNKNLEDIRRARARISKYGRVSCDSSVFERTDRDLSALFPDRRDDRDESDLRQLARTAASEARVFVTRDERLLGIADRVYEISGVRVVHPATVVSQLDELRRETEYQPARLAGTLLEDRRVKASDQEQLLQSFQLPAKGETKSDLRSRLRRFLADPLRYECRVFVQKPDRLIGLAVYNLEKEDELRVPMLRVGGCPLAQTMSRYLVTRVVVDTCARKRTVTRIMDSRLDAPVIGALLESFFREHNRAWLKASPQIADNALRLSEYLSALASAPENECTFLSEAARLLGRKGATSDVPAMLDLERLLWPAKILDAEIPTFIVPIKPTWAQHLFEERLANQTLFGAETSLALSGEMAYYRSAKPLAGLTPGRVLWYVVHDRTYRGTKCIRACAHIDEVAVGKPKELYRRFRRLGVFTWEHVSEVVGGDTEKDMMAFRFSDSELFVRPVSLRDLKLIMEGVGCGLQLQSPCRIPISAFAAIYRTGTGAEKEG